LATVEVAGQASLANDPAALLDRQQAFGYTQEDIFQVP
jgi:hypothetical protein